MFPSKNIPSWLVERPEVGIPSPVQTRIQDLPFNKLTWQNFERLCYRLACTLTSVEQCRIYGNEGDDQEGIDFFARMSQNDKYNVYQCKREKDFGPRKIINAVEVFLEGQWLEKCSEFILCTQESLQSRIRTDEFEKQAVRLREHGVALKCWDSPQLNALLKEHPNIVADFFGSFWSDAFCGKSQELPNVEPSLKLEYLDWILNVTSTYGVPGLSVDMPINDAWIQLQAMDDEKDRRENKEAFEKALLNYQEWLRLDNESGLSSFSAEELYLIDDHVVIIGGPGSGKSTLCKRLTNMRSSEGKIVLLVRLKRVQQLVSRGLSFEDALTTEATDGKQLTHEQRLRLVSSSTILIADGLDECDPSRSDIAESIRKWSTGHTGVKILVTTRPVGHHPSLLPNFHTFELLPLDMQSVQMHALRLFKAVLGEGTDSVEKWAKFVKELSEEKSSVKTLASRNPLLLGFLVRLTIDGVEIGSDRNEVFGQVLQLMEANSHTLETLSLDRETANELIDVMGYQMIHNPTQTIGELVKKTSANSNAQYVRSVLRFWEDCRTIERVSAGHLSAIVFVHPSIGEFCAARYVASFDDKTLRQWLIDFVRKPMWRQVVLLACQRDSRIMPLLTELGDLSDPCSIEVTIAAEAIAESSNLQCHVDLVAGALLSRITSRNPLTSIESSLALQSIVKYWKKDSALFDEQLLDHEQEWTRLGALSLLIHLRTESAIKHFERWLQTFTYESGFYFGSQRKMDQNQLPKETGELQHEIIKVGLPIFLASRERTYVERYFREGRDFGWVSTGMLQSIQSTLENAGFNDLATFLNRNFDSKPIDFSNVEFHDVLVEGIEVACGFSSLETVEDDNRKLSWIQAIVATLQLGECPISEGCFLRRRIGFEQFVEVLKGMICALAPDYGELKDELSAAKGRFAKHQSMYSIYGEGNLRKADWTRLSNLKLDADLLERALEHPHSAVRYGAASLLYNGVSGRQLSDIANRILDNGSYHAVRYASHLFKVAFPDRVSDLAITRLRSGLRPGFESLVEIVLEDADENLLSSLQADIPNWLIHPDPYFVSKVAELLGGVRNIHDHLLVNGIHIAFEYWTVKGSWCRDHEIPTQNNSCPECNLVIPSPRAKILSLLAKLGHFQCGDLLPLLSNTNSKVMNAAKTATLDILRHDETCVSTIIQGIESGDIPMDFLNDVSNLASTILRPHKSKFERLLQSDFQQIRSQALNNLTGEWLKKEESILWAEKFLLDSEPSMVTAATRILRQLKNV